MLVYHLPSIGSPWPRSAGSGIRSRRLGIVAAGRASPPGRCDSLPRQRVGLGNGQPQTRQLRCVKVTLCAFASVTRSRLRGHLSPRPRDHAPERCPACRAAGRRSGFRIVEEQKVRRIVRFASSGTSSRGSGFAALSSEIPRRPSSTAVRRGRHAGSFLELVQHHTAHAGARADRARPRDGTSIGRLSLPRVSPAWLAASRDGAGRQFHRLGSRQDRPAAASLAAGPAATWSRPWPVDDSVGGWAVASTSVRTGLRRAGARAAADLHPADEKQKGQNEEQQKVLLLHDCRYSAKKTRAQGRLPDIGSGVPGLWSL